MFYSAPSRPENLDDVIILGGRIVPDKDIPRLKELGVIEVPTPRRENGRQIQSFARTPTTLPNLVKAQTTFANSLA